MVVGYSVASDEEWTDALISCGDVREWGDQGVCVLVPVSSFVVASDVPSTLSTW